MKDLLNLLNRQIVGTRLMFEQKQEVNNLSTALLVFSYPFNYQTSELVRKEVEIFGFAAGGHACKYFLKNEDGKDIKLLELKFYVSSIDADPTDYRYCCEVVYHSAMRTHSDEPKSKWFERVFFDDNDKVKTQMSKAVKWDNLDIKISKFYPDGIMCDVDKETGEEIESESLSLADIGEVAARAFGYM